MKIKVCGMGKNIPEIATLGPDYLGFIFWPDSSRFMTRPIPELPQGIERVGVFVDQELEEVIRVSWENNLDYVQLHGSESPEYCAQLVAVTGRDPRKQRGSKNSPGIIKAFNIAVGFDFDRVQHYAPYCDYFLFDAKGDLPGGNSRLFDWELLATYKGTVPFFLSGGIGPQAIPAIEEFVARDYAGMIAGIDVNSKFEIAPAQKDPETLGSFIRALRKSNPNNF